MPCRWRMVTKDISSTELASVILLRLGFRRFLSEMVTPQLWGAAVVETGRNFGYTKWDKTSLNGTFLALHVETAITHHTNNSQRHRETLLIGVWGRRARQKAVVGYWNDSRGVFVNSKLRPSSTKNSKNRETTWIINFTHGSLVRWLYHVLYGKTAFNGMLLFSRRILSILGTYQCAKHLRKRKLRSHESFHVIGQERGKTELKSWNSCTRDKEKLDHFFWDFEIRITVMNPWVYFLKLYEHVSPKRQRPPAWQHSPESSVPWTIRTERNHRSPQTDVL